MDLISMGIVSNDSRLKAALDEITYGMIKDYEDNIEKANMNKLSMVLVKSSYSSLIALTKRRSTDLNKLDKLDSDINRLEENLTGKLEDLPSAQQLRLLKMLQDSKQNIIKDANEFFASIPDHLDKFSELEQLYKEERPDTKFPEERSKIGEFLLEGMRKRDRLMDLIKRNRLKMDESRKLKQEKNIPQ